MDAFAENQMGRNEVENNSMLDLTQAAAIQAKRLRRGSKESVGAAAVEVEVAVELLAAPSTSPDDDNPDDVEDVDVPGMSTDESAIIARRWDRRKSSFMPVSDPYGEPDENTSQARLMINAYCTCDSLAATAKRLLFAYCPVLTWLPKITRDSLKSDVIAGLTVGVMLIPQSMSYASIAGLQYKCVPCRPPPPSARVARTPHPSAAALPTSGHRRRADAPTARRVPAAAGMDCTRRWCP